MSGVKFSLFIDADNQSANVANSLFGYINRNNNRVFSATIAGNSNGKPNEAWVKALRDFDPHIQIESIVVPCHPDAADAALILELGQNLRGFCNAERHVIIVSRDDVLVSAAEWAQGCGLQISLAYANTGQALKKRNTTVPICLLSRSNVSRPASISNNKPSRDDTSVASTDIQKIIERMDSKYTRTKNGGFLKTHVGYELYGMGYKTKASREDFLRKIPGLKEKGTGVALELIF